MREQAMLDRVVLRGIGWVMRHPNLQPQLVHQPLKIGPEQVSLALVVIRGVAAAPIAQQQERPGVGVGQATEALPPILQAVTGKFTRIMTRAEMDVSAFLLKVVDPGGQAHPLGEPGEVVVEHRIVWRVQSVPWRKKLPSSSRAFRSMLRIGSADARYSALIRAIVSNWAS